MVAEGSSSVLQFVSEVEWNYCTALTNPKVMGYVNFAPKNAESILVVNLISPKPKQVP